MAFIVRWK